MAAALIDLDAAASTRPIPPSARVRELLEGRVWGNPSSLHAAGRRLKQTLDEAREVLAEAWRAEFGEVLFTSGGTEAANLALLGPALAHHGPRRRVLVSRAEHHCVLHTLAVLERLGFQVDWLPVDRVGRVWIDGLEAELGEDVLMVVAMHANNELGTLNPVEDIRARCHSVGALFVCDSVQTFPALPPVEADLSFVSGHKFHGPPGVGAIRIRAGTPVEPVLRGGGQEREMRAGTENVAAALWMAEAVLEHREHPEWTDQRRAARDAFADELDPSFVPTAPGVPTLSGHLHGRFPGIDAETALIRFDRAGVLASSGAACSSGSVEPSHVMLACGYDAKEAGEALRFTFSKDVSPDLARDAARRVNACIQAIFGNRTP